jgi:hypothetical protein
MSLANRFAGLSQGFTDNKPVFLAKEAAKRIASAFSSYKRKTRVLTQKYFTENTFEQTRWLQFGATGPFSGISMGHLATDSTFATVDPATIISYLAFRSKTDQGFLANHYYYDQFNIETPEGSLSATYTYIDNRVTPDTTLPFQKFLVTNGDGIFKYCSSVIIEFDNDGSKFGVAKSRRITFYEYFS